jgi:exopolysaccharide biosynthesis WecB/TagA/CpsF family protein
LGGILIDQLDLTGALQQIQHFVTTRQPHQVVTVNLDFLSISARDLEFREVLNTADLAVADGMPLVWLSHLRGEPLAERVAGVDLVVETCRLAAANGQSVFLLGAAEGVADIAANRLRVMFPGLNVSGTYSPPVGALSGRENDLIVNMIRTARPDFLFVALGAPTQDLWIREHQQQLQVPVAIGVGCVFDLLAGSAKRAPMWMQAVGLEWAFRLIREPARLWRRYLIDDVPTLARLALASRVSEPSKALAGTS